MKKCTQWIAIQNTQKKISSSNLILFSVGLVAPGYVYVILSIFITDLVVDAMPSSLSGVGNLNTRVELCSS